MSQREHAPLTPEERELQQRLARLGAGAEPSPALDARIRAAAQSAAMAGGTPTSRTGQERRAMRWPLGLGLAASLALAFGIAWQLRPLPEAGVEYSEAPAAAIDRQPGARRADAAADSLESTAAAGSQGVDASAPDQAGAADDALAGASATKPAHEPKPQEAVATSSANATPPASASEPKTGRLAEQSKQAAPPAPPPPPAPPSAFPPRTPPAPAPAPRSTTVTEAAAAASGPGSLERTAITNSPGIAGDAAARQAAPATDRTEVTGSRIRRDQAIEESDTVFDEAPPASVDSPEVKAAWLARIRELVVDGQIDAARDSLREFNRRYPRAEVPADLRPLLD